jgi:hypothetical protein
VFLIWQLGKRFFVVRELSETEQSYVKSLQLLVDVRIRSIFLCNNRLLQRVKSDATLFRILQVFLKPLRSRRDLISEADLRVLFSCIETIIPFQQTFADAIHQKVIRWNVDSRIGDSLLDLTKFINIYTEYINNYDTASALALKLESQPAFKAYLEVRTFTLVLFIHRYAELLRYWCV